MLGGDNQFQYAPNPVEWVDPFGLKSWLQKAIDAGRSFPAGLAKKDAHGHHIVFKGKYKKNLEMFKVLQRSKAILKKYSIDVVNDVANLMIAKNGKGVHTAQNAKKVADLLEDADKQISQDFKCGKISRKESKEKMKDKLQEIGYQVFGGYT